MALLNRPVDGERSYQVGLHLDFDVDSGREVQTHQRIDRLRGRLLNLDQSLMGTNLELLTRILVLVRRLVNRIRILVRGQRNGTDYLGPTAFSGRNNLLRTLVDDFVVIGLEADADVLSCVVFFCQGANS